MSYLCQTSWAQNWSNNLSKLLFTHLNINSIRDKFKSNPDKFHLPISSNENVTIHVGEYEIENGKCEKLLGVKLDWTLNFDDHISDVCKKASRKLNALARIATFIRLSKRRLLMNAFCNSQFSYCPLIWMCHSLTNNRKINRLHERCLRVIYNDKQSLFSELLEKEGSVSIHMNRNIQSLAIDMFHVSRSISPPIMNDIFKQKENSRYNLREISKFLRPLVKSVYHGSESVSFLGPKICYQMITKI